MSLSKQELIRLPILKKGLFEGKTLIQIGEDCGVTEKTMDRTMKSWVDSGDFETWLKEEWLRVYVDIKKIKPIIAFEALNSLVGKMLTRKIERKEQIDIRQIIVKKWQVEENESANRSDDSILASQ